MRLLGIDLGSSNHSHSIIETDDLSETQPTLVTLLKIKYIYLTAPKVGDKLNVLKHQLEKDIEDYMVDAIIFEDSVFRGRNAPALNYVAGIFHLLAATYDIPIHDPKPTQIKKLICGDGKADKKWIETEANKWLTNPQVSFENDHCSDSMAIAIYGYLKYYCKQK